MELTTAVRPKTLTVSTVRKIEYSVIHPDAPVFAPHSEDLKHLCESRPVFFVVDATLFNQFDQAIGRYATNHLGETTVFPLACEETDKTWPTVDRIIDQLIEAHFPRHGIIIAVGGGCLLDTVGLAASLYRRGVDYIRVPTTLLGMVDVAVGIKHGVNHRNKKNLLGTFYPSLAAINDVSFLATLAPRDFACGYAEMLKIAAIGDAELFHDLETNAAAFPHAFRDIPRDVLLSLIVRSEEAMLAELHDNFYEDRLARLADFGHTFSPLLEIQSDAKVAHGEAVAIDMIYSAAIAVTMGLCTESYLDRFIRSCAAAKLDVRHDLCSVAALEEAIVAQRAHRGGNLNLVVPITPGCGAFVQTVSRDQLTAAVALVDDRVDALGI